MPKIGLKKQKQCYSQQGLALVSVKQEVPITATATTPGFNKEELNMLNFFEAAEFNYNENEGFGGNTRCGCGCGTKSADYSAGLHDGTSAH
jgi:hypothetical protein